MEIEITEEIVHELYYGKIDSLNDSIAKALLENNECNVGNLNFKINESLIKWSFMFGEQEYSSFTEIKQNPSLEDLKVVVLLLINQINVLANDLLNKGEENE